VHADVTWRDPRSRSLSFWSSENCTFLRLSPQPFWRGTQNWWLITLVWDLVYSFSEPHFWISPPLGGHVILKFAKCWYHQNPLGFISALAEARSLWLWLQVGRNKPCTLVAMTISPLLELFFFIVLCIKWILIFYDTTVNRFHENSYILLLLFKQYGKWHLLINSLVFEHPVLYSERLKLQNATSILSYCKTSRTSRLIVLNLKMT